MSKILLFPRFPKCKVCSGFLENQETNAKIGISIINNLRGHCFEALAADFQKCPEEEEEEEEQQQQTTTTTTLGSHRPVGFAAGKNVI